MFTGIIHHTAMVTAKKDRAGTLRMAFRWQERQNGVASGESVAINGVCLTACRILPRGFEADVVRETLKATTLGSLAAGDEVNTERSLRAGDRISGHFVSGHVDGRGKIEAVEKIKRDYLFMIRLPSHLLRLAAPKGSIAVDGISLTIQAVFRGCVRIAVIPHTYEVTTLRNRKAGDEVNLEMDMMARYLAAQLNAPVRKSRLTENLLKEQGF